MELVRCKSCGLRIPVRSTACWRCDYPTIYSLAEPVRREGLHELTQAVVIFSIFGIVLLGMLTLDARAHAIAALPPPTPPAPVVAGNLPTPRTPRPEPTLAAATAAPTPTPTPAPVLPAAAALIDRGEWAVITADDVVIRTAPSRDASSQIIGTYDAGAFVQVRDGPELGSGYYWFFVEGEGPTGWVAAGTAAGAWIVRADAPGATANVPPGTASIAGAEIVYYEISGSTPAQLREQIRRFGPDSDPGTDVIATAEFVPGWVDVPVTEHTEIGGIVSITSYYACDMKWKFVVTLPRWVGPSPAPQSTVAWWNESLRRIVDHEATHVRIWQDALPSLEARLSSQMPCDQAATVLDDWLAEVDVAQSAFDADFGYLDWPAAP